MDIGLADIELLGQHPLRHTHFGTRSNRLREALGIFSADLPLPVFLSAVLPCLNLAKIECILLWGHHLAKVVDSEWFPINIMTVFLPEMTFRLSSSESASIASKMEAHGQSPLYFATRGLPKNRFLCMWNKVHILKNKVKGCADI